jgi:hypothetical protein
VILNAPNLSVYALTTTQNWRMEVAPDDSFRLIDMRSPKPAGERRSIGQQIGRSALALALWRRFGLIRIKPPTEYPARRSAIRNWRGKPPTFLAPRCSASRRPMDPGY